MAQKLSVTIALAGGKEIEKQLESIGEAGQKAFADIANAADKAGKGLKDVTAEEATKKLEQLGIKGPEAINKIQAAVKQAGRLESLVQGIATVESAFTALGQNAVPILGAIVTGFVALTKQALAWADAVNKASAEAIKLGQSVEQVSKLRAAFEKAGIGAEAISDGLKKINETAQKGQLAAIATALGQLQEASKRGFGPMGTPQLKLLLDLAGKFGPVGDAAQKALADLGIQYQSNIKSLQELQQRFGETQGLVAFIQQLEAMKDPILRNAVALDQLGEKFGTELMQGLNTGSLSAEKFAQSMTAAAQVTQAQAVEAAKTQQTLNQLSAEWNNFKAAVVAPVAIPLLSFLRSELEAIRGHIRSTIAEFTKLGEVITVVFNNPGGNTYNELIKIGEATVKLTAKLAEAAEWLGKVFGGGGEPGSVTPAPEGPGFAHGGMVGGRGTGTSDSNLAWVSRGEHIMPARAVRQPGVLAFLEALRRSGGDLSRVLDRMGHFAAGGLVTMPALASGGISGMSHVTIQFPGLPAIGGLRASSDVVDQLRKEAALAQVRSGGRKPSRYT